MKETERVDKKEAMPFERRIECFCYITKFCCFSSPNLKHALLLPVMLC